MIIISTNDDYKLVLVIGEMTHHYRRSVTGDLNARAGTAVIQCVMIFLPMFLTVNTIYMEEEN